MNIDKLASYATSDFRLKLFVQKLYSFFPYKVHRFLADRHPKLKAVKDDSDIRDQIIKKKIRQISEISEFLDLRNKTIIETGTGGSLKDPITYYLAGAKETHTVDIRQHSDYQKAWKIITFQRQLIFSHRLRIN